MTRKPAQRGGARAAPAPPVTWHDYYRDPVHDIVLVSSDKVHFRASRFHLNRVSEAFQGAESLSAIIGLFADHSSAVVELFLDLCHGRPILKPGMMASTVTSSLIKLINDTRSHELRRRLFAIDVLVGRDDLDEALRIANDNNDVVLAANCIKKLASSMFLEAGGQQVCDVRHILDKLQLQWKAVLFDILLQNHGPCQDRYPSYDWDPIVDGVDRVVIRHDWSLIALEFEEEAKSVIETNGSGQVDAQQSQAKRPAEAQPLSRARSTKTRRTGNH